MLETGTPAPIFTLPDQNGKDHNLSDYKGKWVLIYFYPKDDTPGCTVEACSLRDTWSEFAKNNSAVLGISADTVESHKKFEQHHSLNFPILSDVDKEVIQTYGAWQEKINFGKKSYGIKRMSYLIAPDGTIKKIYKSIKPEIHAQQVLKDMATFKNQ